MGRDKRNDQPTAGPQACARKPRLSLVETSVVEPEPSSSWFCGYCAAGPSAGAAVTPASRVCGRCGRGLLLETRSDAAPRRHEPFIVVDSRLAVQAVSRGAEQQLAIRGRDVIDRPVGDLLVAAEPERPIERQLPGLLARTVAGGDRPITACVRPRDTFGVRFAARIGACGPPRAALIVLLGALRKPHLRLVTDWDRAIE
jgi:hypothetical protein